MQREKVAQVLDFGPGLTDAEVDVRLRVSLWKGIQYYVQAGIPPDHRPFTTAHILSLTVTDEPSGITGCSARRIEADVLFMDEPIAVIDKINKG